MQTLCINCAKEHFNVFLILKILLSNNVSKYISILPTYVHVYVLQQT